MKKIEFLLIQIEGYLYLNYPEVLHFYNNAIPERLNYADDSLVKLYEWKNGSKLTTINEIGRFEFCSFGYFLPLKDALMYQSDFNNEKYFKKNTLLPIIGSLAGDFLLVDTSKKSSKVYLYSPSLLITKPIEIYQSIERFIETIYEALETKTYKYNSQYYLDVNYKAEKEIALKLNPKCDYWKK